MAAFADIAARWVWRLLGPVAGARWRRGAVALIGGGLLAVALNASAATNLADQPLFAANAVPGNVALALSVEFPTAVRAAYPDTNAYASTSTYYGYFDPEKCYGYNYVATESASPTSANGLNHFYPAGSATAHVCASKWSGNYLNWATTQTIDPFRQTLTGGYRVYDSVTETVLQKASQSGQGTLFPDKTLASATTIAGASPSSSASLVSRVQPNSGGLGIGFRFSTVPANTGLVGQYYATTDLSGSSVLTRTEVVDFNWAGASPGKDSKGNAIPASFSARWTASIKAPATGTYSFRTVSDDGVRLYVNGSLVIDDWVAHTAKTDTTPATGILLTAGDNIDIKLEYYNNNANALGTASLLQLLWAPPTGSGAYTTFLGGVAAASVLPYDGKALLANVTYEAKTRAKVCDISLTAGPLESNCVQYGVNYKPEGLIQQYAKKMRFSAFGYLNDSNSLRDGGVMRARQKFVGPLQPVPNSDDIVNSAAEWDALTGVFAGNPDKTDADATSTNFGVNVTNSGVVNYLNKFGQITPGNYKSSDPVSELYYATLRYYKNLGNVASWIDMSTASTATKQTYVDGFPVIKKWDDPIQYACQRNFVLGIGDIYTHADKNVPGNTNTANEPTMPPEVAADTTVDAVDATNRVGVMQGLGSSYGTATNVSSGCCTNNSALMAGLAYNANTQDIRKDDPQSPNTIGKQTVQTYWVDVLEKPFVENNQYFLAAKFGGFTVPKNYDYARTADLPTSWWSTTGDTVGTKSPATPRPDNYFTAGRPDTMRSGLIKAFASIASQIKTTTTSFSTSDPQVANTNNASYSASFDGTNGAWTGEIVASALSFDSSGKPSTVNAWSATTVLATQLSGTGWKDSRNVVTWNTKGVPFLAASLSSTQLGNLDTPYRSGDDSSDFINYLRGDRSQEQGSSVANSSLAYRTRTLLLGDIVGSAAVPVGAPSLPLGDSANPGYSAFKGKYKDRTRVVYVGANDGMLHAFKGVPTSTQTYTDGGKELFAYVPSVTIAGPSGTPSVDGLVALGNPVYDHHFFVNATPTYADVDLGRTWNGSAVGNSTNWASLLIGGLGKGGKAFYAIDVTDTDAMAKENEGAIAKRIKWEFTDAKRLGFTYGQPLVIKTKQYGWTVVLPSGYNNADGKGYLFFVQPDTGALLQVVATGEGSTSNDAGLAHVNGYTVDFTDGTADAVYAGDLLGNVWRVDLSSATGAFPIMKLAQLTDPSKVGVAQPVTSRPHIELHPKTKKRVVLIGTGKQLATNDMSSTQLQSFYAINDGDAVSVGKAADLPKGVTYPLQRANLTQSTTIDGFTYNPSSTLGWYIDLGKAANGIAWRVIIEPETFYGTVAFASTASVLDDPCNPSGKSRAYAVDFSTSKSKVLVDNVVSQYWDKTTGVITQLQFFSVNGTARLIGGSDQGAIDNITGQYGNTINLKRLNWRELQIAN